jgi:hypothetical protein
MSNPLIATLISELNSELEKYFNDLEIDESLKERYGFSRKIQTKEFVQELIDETTKFTSTIFLEKAQEFSKLKGLNQEEQTLMLNQSIVFLTFSQNKVYNRLIAEAYEKSIKEGEQA